MSCMLSNQIVIIHCHMNVVVFSDHVHGDGGASL